MPELPEVETIARGLDKRVAGDVIESVWIGSKPEPLKSPAKQIAKVLEGARINKVKRVGKHIVVDLAPSGEWIVHLGMTGQMLVAAPDSALAKPTHLVAKLSSGRELRFVDPRRLGRLSVQNPENAFAAQGGAPLGVSEEEVIAVSK